MKSLFITGASGFVGSCILRNLKPQSFEKIILLSRSEPILPENLASSDNIKVISASIENVDSYASCLDENTIIVHLAALTGKAHPKEYFAVNTNGTRALINAAVSAGIKGFLFVSSIAVSFKDRRGYSYAESKELAENVLKDSGLKFCIVRPTIILGEGSPIWNSFNSLAKSSRIVLPGDGNVRIQPIYDDDIVRLLFEIVDSERFDGEVLELGGPDVLTINDFVKRIHKAHTGGVPRLTHLPLGFIVGSLRLVEMVFPALLPVNSGQFASFSNDGTAVGNSLVTAASGNMKSIDNIIELLVGNNRNA